MTSFERTEEAGRMRAALWQMRYRAAMAADSADRRFLRAWDEAEHLKAEVLQAADELRMADVGSAEAAWECDEAASAAKTMFASMAARALAEYAEGLAEEHRGRRKAATARLDAAHAAGWSDAVTDLAACVRCPAEFSGREWVSYVQGFATGAAFVADFEVTAQELVTS